MSARCVSDAVYRNIKAAIVEGELRPGQSIQEQAVAEEYQVSRASARSALQRLCHESYLKSFPRKGYLVSSITPQQCRQIQQLRYQIESLALQLIIDNCTEEEILSLGRILNQNFENKTPEDTKNFQFHTKLAELSGNAYIAQVLENLIGEVCRFVITSPAAVRSGFEENHHQAILQALLSRDLPAARQALQQDMQMGNTAEPTR